MDIGNKIKLLRQKYGITQEQLGEKIGVSAQSISKWETGITMPDITLLPILSCEFGVTIDELFDLTTGQKLQRIENRLDIEENLSDDAFHEYENILKVQLEESRDRRILSLLARLYHHRAESYLRKVSKYAREAILLAPEIKDCQWLLQKASGAAMWDWNCSNHTDIIDFYRKVIENNAVASEAPLPYYEIMSSRSIFISSSWFSVSKYLDKSRHTAYTSRRTPLPLAKSSRCGRFRFFSPYRMCAHRGAHNDTRSHASCRLRVFFICLPLWHS